MSISRAAAVWIAIALAAVGSLGAARLLGPPPNPEDLIPIRVTGGATRAGNMVTYSFTITSQTGEELADLFIAGKVPPGAAFEDAVASPAGARFRGYEAGGTSLQAAGWEVETMPARSVLGPFSYRVQIGGETDARTQVWVRWTSPVEGSAISPDLVP